MPAIDKDNLVRAMDGAGVTAKPLAETVGISLQYMVDITKGRRTLKRNPELRQKIAQAIGCPRFWIEHHDDSEAAA